MVVPSPAIAKPKQLEIEPTGPRVTEAPFELVMSHGPCVTVHGRLHCPEKLSPQRAFTSTPAETDLEGVTSIAFGRDHHCAVVRDGHVQCVGGNELGQLGAGLSAERASATVVPHLADVRSVVAGPFTTCAIHTGGAVSCWGRNEHGESGSSTTYLQDARELVEPETVRGLADVEDVAIGWASSCATTTKGEVLCWGRATLPEHEQQRGPQHEEPTPIASLSGAKLVVANESGFCAIRQRKVTCWGDLAMLAARVESRAPRVIDVPNARRVSLGANHGCAVTDSGEVLCFGANYGGVLGKKAREGDYEPHAPTKVDGLPPVIDVKCGSDISCAVTAAHDVYCWGHVGGSDQGISASPVRMRVLE